MTGEGFEGLVTQNLSQLTSDIRNLRMSIELIQTDVLVIKTDLELAKQKQKDLAGPLSNWSLADTMALKKVIDREKLQDAAADWRDAQKKIKDDKSNANTKRIQGWRDRLLLATAIFAIFNPFTNFIRTTVWNAIRYIFHF